MIATEPAATATRKKLGKGLGALLGETRRDAPVMPMGGGDEVDRGAAPTDRASPAGALQTLEIAAISPLPNQPRTRFAEGALDELAASIRARGVIQPIIVRPLEGNRYQLIAGERRWRAAQRAQLHSIPAIVRDLGEREVLAISLIENLQREDLNPIEEARAYRQLSAQEGMTQAEIAVLVDKSRSHIANLQRLLDLPEDVLELVEAGELSMGHARALIGHADAPALARKAVAQGLSVRAIEKMVKAPDGEKRAKGPKEPNADSADIAAVQRHLEEFLGMPVRIVTENSPHHGAVTIRYRTLDQLDLICQRLTGGDI